MSLKIGYKIELLAESYTAADRHYPKGFKATLPEGHKDLDFFFRNEGIFKIERTTVEVKEPPKDEGTPKAAASKSKDGPDKQAKK